MSFHVAKHMNVDKKQSDSDYEDEVMGFDFARYDSICMPF